MPRLGWRTPAPTASAPNGAKRTAYDNAVRQADSNDKVEKDKCDAMSGDAKSK
jgi:hypothetical protein